MKKKATFEVDTFRRYVNDQLQRTDSEATDDFKNGMCLALERILHGSDCYRGFNYLYWLKGGCDEWTNAGQPDFPEKDKFIYGEKGSKYNGCKFARLYY
jgi:hypothetical protein